MVRFTIQLESFDLDEFLVAFVVPGIVSKEPRCMHVKTPGSPKRDGGNESHEKKMKILPVALHQLSVKIQIAFVDPLEVLHQHVVDLVGVLWLGPVVVLLSRGNKFIGTSGLHSIL